MLIAHNEFIPLLGGKGLFFYLTLLGLSGSSQDFVAMCWIFIVACGILFFFLSCDKWDLVP